MSLIASCRKLTLPRYDMRSHRPSHMFNTRFIFRAVVTKSSHSLSNSSISPRVCIEEVTWTTGPLFRRVVAASVVNEPADGVAWSPYSGILMSPPGLVSPLCPFGRSRPPVSNTQNGIMPHSNTYVEQTAISATIGVS